MEQKSEIAIVDEKSIYEMIYEIRGQKVMLDVDLARIYGYSTKAFNQQVKRNEEKFDDDFMFQLTLAESQNCLRSQFVTLNESGNMRGQHIKYLPYAFTEQGIYMLMTVLKGDLATEQSKALIRIFKGMKDYISNNFPLMGPDNIAKLAIQTNENSTAIARIESKIKEEVLLKSDLPKIFKSFQAYDEKKEFLIMNGQIVEADVTYQKIYSKAKHSIYIIDDYIGIKTLMHLRKIAANVEVVIFSDNKKKYLSDTEWEDFIKEYPDTNISFRRTNGKIHDRYIILDFAKRTEHIYHCGASSKDAGKRVTTIMEVADRSVYREFVENLTYSDKSLII